MSPDRQHPIHSVVMKTTWSKPILSFNKLQSAVEQGTIKSHTIIMYLLFTQKSVKVVCHK